MALDPRLILSGSQAAIQANNPLQALVQGIQAGQGIRSNLLAQQQIQDQMARAAALQPLKQRALEQQLAAGQVDIAAARQAQAQAEKISAARSVKNMLNSLSPFVDQGDLEGAANQLESFRELGADDDDLSRLNSLLSGDPDSVKAQFKRLDDSLSAYLGDKEDLTAGQKEFESLTEGLSEEEKVRAQRIRLGLDPRAVGSGTITTATTEGLTDLVAKSEASIEERKKFAELTGASRSKRIDEGFTRIEKIDTNVRNLDRAIKAIDDGASTGAIESRFFPTLRRATKELEQVQKELGLDVVGSVTFGALSEAELDLALQTALPTGLEPDALRQFLENKKAAQQKLREYYQDQINFLDQGGSIAGFLRQQERGRKQQGGQADEFREFKVIR